MELTAAAVSASLNLGPEFTPWLLSLEATGPPPKGVPLPRGEEAALILECVGVAASELRDILAALPGADQQPELWWLLERSYHQVLLDIGQWEGEFRHRPSLPSDIGLEGRCFWLFVYLTAVEDLRGWHREHGVGDSISWATLADLGRNVGLYRRRHGTAGFEAQFWIGVHFRGLLFEIGRLQFIPYRLRTGPPGPLFWYETADADRMGPGFRAGDWSISAHIPEAGPLTPAACEASLHAAKAFFASFMPGITFPIVTCTSWVLDEQLSQYLPATSNLIRFQQRFEIVPGTRDADDDMLRFVFGKVPESLAGVPVKTALERAVAGHLLSGRHWHMRTGWLRL